MKFEKKVSLKLAIALVLIASLLSSSIVYYVFAVSPSSTFTISSGVYPGAPSYTVWREGSNYFAKDANGEIDSSGTVFATVMQYAIDNRPNGGPISLLPGRYLLTATLNVTTSNFGLYGGVGASGLDAPRPGETYGVVIEGDGSTFPLIKFKNAAGTRLERITINHVGFLGRATEYHAGWDNLYFHNCAEVWIEGCEIYGAGDCGIEFNATGESQWVTYNDISLNYGCGIETLCVSHIQGNLIWLNQLHGINVVSSEVEVLDNRIIWNYQNGIFIDYCWNVVVEGNYIMENGYSGPSTYAGINVYYYAHNSTIVGNKLLNNYDYDIWIGNTVENTLCVGNNCNSWKNTKGIYDQGTNSQIHSCFNGTAWIS